MKRFGHAAQGAEGRFFGPVLNLLQVHLGEPRQAGQQGCTQAARFAELLDVAAEPAGRLSGRRHAPRIPRDACWQNLLPLELLT
jgi:hypothetical protein